MTAGAFSPTLARPLPPPAPLCRAVEDEAADELGLGDVFGKKKKKKKQAAPKEGEEGDAAAESEEAAGEPAGEGLDLDLDLDLGLGKKKKKKRAKARADDEFGGGADEGGGGGEEGAAAAGPRAGGGLPWDGSDRDYRYDELLDRVFAILKAHNPELTGERRRTTLRPPQVAREGTKKTVFANFMDLCRAMNRNPEHVQAYLLAELGTSGSLDGQARLILKGRFLPKAFEGCLRRYMNEYVLCASCKSPDSLLDRDAATRIMFLRCQACGASRTVSAIKAGFQARTVSRRSQQTG
jgi:translation initiation factor 2 subunit 2